MLTPGNNTRTRPVFKLAAIDDQEKFRPLPQAPGTYPYHLDLGQLTPNLANHKLVFHACGDTGGIQPTSFKHIVAAEMIKQIEEAVEPHDKPRFLFHLGDVVYNYGQAENYYAQFFEAYEHYPAPIFAIAGNHDADIDPIAAKPPQSLDAFMKVFCSVTSGPISFAGNSTRKSNIQPNVFWTLKTPVADIIGLYSNVPRFGSIAADQRQWFIEEMKNTAAQGKALILALHHAPYSADTNHGSSLPMQTFFNAAFQEADVLPDIVLSGHVHNYQRFSKLYPNGKTVPFIISGAGGYADLHKIAPPGDFAFPDHSKLLDNVLLEKYCDNAHGFLKITVEKNPQSFQITGEYYTVKDCGQNTFEASLYDSFAVDLNSKKQF